MQVGGIYCDLAKAFNCANHKILLAKLHFYGIQGTGGSWIRSYLADRKQEVQIKLFSDAIKHLLGYQVTDR